MPKKLYDAVKQTTRRNRSRMRQKFLSAIACLIVFCITYTWVLPSLAYNRPANDEIPGETIVESEDMIVSTLDTDSTDANDWEDLFADTKLTGIWRDDLLSIANSQLGYSESERNFIVSDAAGATKGYTRYGEWCGDPYGDWDAMFVAYCLNYARVKDMPLNVDHQAWIDELDVTEEEMKEALKDAQETDLPVDQFFTPDEYTPVCGDLIFFDRAGDGKADHVGIVTELKKDENKKVTEITTIEGNSDDKVQNVTYKPDDSTILGFAALPAQPPTYTFTDNGVEVTIMLPEGTVVPRNAVIKVTPIEDDHLSFKELTAKAESAVDGSVANIKLYDISFYTADGEYIPVDDRAQVSMRFDEPVVKNTSELVVLHYDANDSNPVALKGAAVEEMTSAKAEVTFETEGFSTFAVVQVETGAYEGTVITPNTRENNLVQGYDTIRDLAGDGKQYIIVTADNEYALSGYAELDNEGEDKLQGMEVLKTFNNGKSIYVNANKHLLWTFEETNETGLVYIKNVATGEYLQLVRNNVAITTELLPNDNFENHQMIYAIKDDDSSEVGFCAVNMLRDENGNLDLNENGNPKPDPASPYFWLNRDGGGDNFHTWQGNFSDNNNHFLLYQYSGDVPNIADSNVESPSVNIPNPNTAYLLAGVNYDGQYAEGANLDHPMILTGNVADNQNIETTNGNTQNLAHLTGELATNATYTNNAVSFMTHMSANYFRWLFEPGPNGGYYINRMGTAQYLNAGAGGLTLSEGKQEFIIDDVPQETLTAATNNNNTPDNPDDDLYRVVQNNVIRLYTTVAVTNEDGSAVTDENGNVVTEKYYLFLNGNDPDDNFTAISIYKGNDPATQDATHMVMIPYGQLVDGLEGKDYIIAGVNNSNNINSAAVLTSTPNADGNGLVNQTVTGANITIDEATDSLTNLTIANPQDYAWAFEDAGYGSYHIKSLKTGQYLKIENNSLTTVAVEGGEDPPIIEVTVAKQTGTMSVTQDIVSLRSQNDEYVILYNNNTNNDFTAIARTAADDYSTNRGNHLVLVEYKATEDRSTLATDLAGKVFFVVSVNNADNNATPPALASKDQQTTVRVPVTINDGNVTLSSSDIDEEGILGWVFEQTSKTGEYYIRAVYGPNKGEYLNVVASPEGNADFAMTNTPQPIEVVRADTSGLGLDDDDLADLVVKDNVVSLRASVNGVYYYIHLGNNYPNQVTSGFQCKVETDGKFNVLATHFQLVEIPEVNNVVTKINTLLDNMIEQDDGSWIFSDAAYAGSAAPDNDNNGQQGGYSNNYQQPFMDDYDQAQAYRREMQLLAREIRKLYADLPAEDQRYVWRYEIVDSSGEVNADGTSAKNEKDLEWLWQVVETVPSNDPIGVKVELFNYNEAVNNTGLAYRGENYNDPYGFTFYHKIQYDEYTMVDKGRDETRHGGTLGTDNSVLTMSPTLGDDGFPVVTGGAREGDEYIGDDEGKSGSLAYLFNPTASNDFHVATMTDGGGLFQKDSEGFYYYYANQNAAYYVDKNGATIDGNYYNNEFVLYDTVIRPMYIHGSQPNAINDVYNFLPFNNPYDDLIFDEPDTITTNNSLTGYGADSEHAANTEKSGYLNERADMWFGMTIEFSFMMANGGMIDILDANGQPTGEQVPMEFDFYGDDDVWVYIDNQLVLDMGGVKGAEKGSINFSTGAVSYQDGDRGTISKTLAEIFADVEGAQLEGSTFKDGVVHTVKFFYMERGGNVSYAGIKFNMPILPENFLMVTKTRENDSTDTDAADPIGNPFHTFRVVEANENGQPIDEDGEVTTDLSKMVPYFKANTVFDICIANTTTALETGIVDADGYFSVPVGYSAVFTDVLNLRRDTTQVYYTVVEVLFDSEEAQYSALNYTLSTVQPRADVANTSNGKLDFSYTGAESMWDKRPIGTYTFTSGIELDANNDNTLDLSNVINPPLGKLAVTKKLADGVEQSQANLTKEFTIKVELGGWAIVDRDGVPSYEVVYTPVPKGTKYTLTYTDENNQFVTEQKTVESSDGTIKLKPGQTATFEGIVANTNYRITEVLGTDDKWTPTYTGTVSKLSADGTVDTTVAPKSLTFTGGNANGTFAYQDFVQVDITNQNFNVSAEIPIRKKVNYAAFTDTFTFLVQNITGATTPEQAIAAADGYYDLPGTSITVSPADAIAGKVGTAVIGFSDTAISGMPNETGNKAYYKISEVQGNGSYIYDNTYYIIEVTLSKLNGGNAEITGVWKNGTEALGSALSETNALEFVNHRTTSVTVDKEVVGGDTGDEFEFTYTVKENANSTTEYKTGSFTLKHDGKYTITGIPVGYIVEVTEKDRDDYEEFYQVTGIYEAEYGNVSDAKIVTDINAANASAYGFVGNILGNSRTVNIPVYTKVATNAAITFAYAQAASRKFAINGTPYSFESTGGWWTWSNKTIDSKFNFGSGSNDLLIGGEVVGTTESDAPNLDYLKIVFDQVVGNTAALNVMGDGSTIHFVNEPRSSVTISKDVLGSDTSGSFNFTATLTDAEGKPVTERVMGNGTIVEVDKNGQFNFSLKDGEEYIISNLPVGTVVNVTETSGVEAGILGTTIVAPTDTIIRLEAEEHKVENGADISSAPYLPSGSYVSNIGNRGTGSVTFTVNDVEAGRYIMRLHFNQNDTRSFGIKVNSGDVFELKCPSSGFTYVDEQGETVSDNKWATDGQITSENWQSYWKTIETEVTLDAGTNTIVISGYNGAYAPNLDYIELVLLQEIDGKTVTVVANGDTTIHYVNETGYTLPETGGTGTLPYTLGGLLLMAVPLLYGCIRKRKRERGAET